MPTVPAVPAAKKPRKPGSGRKKGSVNRTTQQMRELAQQHGPDALQVLVGIMSFGASETARIAAAREVLDRAYGKVAQPVEVADMRVNTDGWSKQRLAAFHGVEVGQIESIQQQAQDEY